ncbi:hypothetical protein Q7C36_001956 [Tachysurus vachellii]|uniref:Ubiquitin-like domain-containing protein n=1 Tax=Tachysurus vachellii TaxID=175792 RepID=A0AA88NY60_TACVA|nr:uncharacterized protein si:ch211-217k17.11 [Tachysurus vachellii]KAK2865900.1 hypothetical protein Q7C36_001956 [Tachysurus vachellii]
MATRICAPRCAPVPKADPPQVAPEPKLHGPFRHTTHSVLQVVFDPQPENFDVKVFDGSNGSGIPFTINITDTTDTLIKMYHEKKPELQGNLHLAYNGKQVPKHKSMKELGVKPGAMFITYQKCTGG